MYVCPVGGLALSAWLSLLLPWFTDNRSQTVVNEPAPTHSYCMYKYDIIYDGGSFNGEQHLDFETEKERGRERARERESDRERERVYVGTPAIRDEHNMSDTATHQGKSTATARLEGAVGKTR